MEEETTGGFRGRWAFLSNMEETPCRHADLVFKSSEHLYQWLKVPGATAEGLAWRERIFNAKHGRRAKTIAALPKCPCKVKKKGDEWDSFRLECMEIALRSKFENPDMRRMLLETGDVTLIEYNHWKDGFWGVCDEMGRNNLGGMLMRLRSEFRELETSVEGRHAPRPLSP